MVASGEPADQVVLAVANELADLLALKECHYSAAYAERPGPFIERDGDVSWGALRWGFQTMGLPEGRSASPSSTRDVPSAATYCSPRPVYRSTRTP
jgi:hypothetical protein